MSRIYKCDAKTLFGAIQEGVLFRASGAKSDMKIDFRPGGEYRLTWGDYPHPTTGVFKAIEPHSRIEFTWRVYHENLKQEIESLVTISIREANGISTLTLVHDNIPDTNDLESKIGGWEDGLSGLHESLRDVFTQLEKNPSGLDLHFKIKRSINAPRSTVFNAVFDHQTLSKYFGVKSSGPLAEGTQVEWKFEGHSPFILHVHQVIKNELIKFQWGKSHVCFSFTERSEAKTDVLIEATGWNADQQGLEDSYSECDGWMEFLVLLKFHIEGKES